MSAGLEWLLRGWTVLALIVAGAVLLHEIRLLALTDVEKERQALREDELALERAWIELHRSYHTAAELQDWPELERGVRISHDGRHTLRQRQGVTG